jgi:hypothetical protein
MRRLGEGEPVDLPSAARFALVLRHAVGRQAMVFRLVMDEQPVRVETIRTS